MLPDNFWAKVAQPNENGCRLWTAALSHNGYGLFGSRAKERRAHRLVWIDSNGPIPDGLKILHECDVRSCVEITHLVLGTQLKNIQDSVARGRHSSVNKYKGWGA